jgi:hypothetical protein
MSALTTQEVYGTIETAEKPSVKVRRKRGNPNIGIAGAATQFQPGQIANPDGRPKNAGLSVREWYNALATCTRAEWEAIAKDRNATGARKAAARRWIDTDDAKHRQLAGSALDAICEQTAGKPVQPIELSGPDGGPIQSQVSFDFSGFAAMFALQANDAPRALPQPMQAQPMIEMTQTQQAQATPATPNSTTQTTAPVMSGGPLG